MRIFVDSASLVEITEWRRHSWVSGFTTNPTLMRAHTQDGLSWAEKAVKEAAGLPISIDGPPEVWKLGDNVWRKMVTVDSWKANGRCNLTAVCTVEQVRTMGENDIISVFAGRIMDTGRDPRPVIDAAKRSKADVLWASVREPYNIVQAEQYGCDIITVPPAILSKYFENFGKPLEVVAEHTIYQFEQDAEGLW